MKNTKRVKVEAIKKELDALLHINRIVRSKLAKAWLRFERIDRKAYKRFGERIY